ncbi:glycosyltransferase [Candidatus Saccharibacteria bacterium]|nr:glycosyltransferase [Candidatus Saccharibacteria bacterium]
MNKKPLISVIVPVYNVEKYLRKCVDSIIGQTYPNLEILLIDDGSTDDSKTIVDEYARDYKQIRAVHQKNGGLSSARNTGIANAQGEWLAFVDSDDYIDARFIEKLYDLAAKNDSDITTCSFEAFTDDNSILKKSPVWPTEVMTGEETVICSFKNKLPAYVCLSLFSAKLFADPKMRFPEGKEFEDIAIRVRLLSQAKKVAFTNEKIYYYLMRGDAITGKKFSKKRYDDYMYALNEVKDYLIENGTEKERENLNYFLYYSQNTLLNYLAREKSTKENMKFWRQIRKNLRELYKDVKFPSTKTRLLYRTALTISKNRAIYSKIYLRTKK